MRDERFMNHGLIEVTLAKLTTSNNQYKVQILSNWTWMQAQRKWTAHHDRGVVKSSNPLKSDF